MNVSASNSDSLKINASENNIDTEAKKVKNYIKPTFFVNTYRTSPAGLKNNFINTSEYVFSQTNLGFFTPLYTNTVQNSKDQTYNTFHLLLTGNFLIARPEIEFKSVKMTQRLFKPALGLRTIYTSGTKSAWFFDLSPFVSQDGGTIRNPTLRFGSVLLYNRTVSKNFSYRIGFIKTFIFGEALPLPIVGMRIGALNSVYFSVQLPRNISLHFPLSKNFAGSVFLKPVGGLYNFHNKDTILKGKNAIGQLRRSEYLSGFQLSYSSSSNFTMYLGAGLATNRKVRFVETKSAFEHKTPFFKSDVLENALFLNFGITLSFGESKRVDNNIVMYDVFDLNNSYDPGDNNLGIPNSNIPSGKPDKLNNIQYNDIKDLFETNDLY